MRTDHIAASVRMADKIRLFRVMLNNPEYGTITSDLSSAIKKKKKELIDSIHTSAVTAPSDRYPYWSTAVYVKEGNTKKRKYIRSKTQAGLYEKLYDHYFGVGTLDQIHALWADHRKKYESLAPETIHRENQRWNKYLQDTGLGRMRINDIDNFMIEDHVYSLIKDYQLKEKELREIQFLLRKTFRFAQRSKVITKNPMEYVEINKTGCAPATPRLSKTRIFLSDEAARMDTETGFCSCWGSGSEKLLLFACPTSTGRRKPSISSVRNKKTKTESRQLSNTPRRKASTATGSFRWEERAPA